jgi:multidrug efflux pump subunit AcrA (membrane-fusion protein)
VDRARHRTDSSDSAAGGIVDTLSAVEGEKVQEGEPLATLRLSSDVASGDAGKSLIADLTDEDRANQAQAQASRDKIAAQSGALVARRSILVRELEDARSTASRASCSSTRERRTSTTRRSQILSPAYRSPGLSWLIGRR